MDQQHGLKGIEEVRRSHSGFGRRIIRVALAASVLASVGGGGVVFAKAAEDFRAPRLVRNVQDFGSPFAASMAAVNDDRGRSRHDLNAPDFGAPAPGG
jgi:hypothetical protein